MTEDRKLSVSYVSTTTLTVSADHFGGSRGVEVYVSNNGTVGYWHPVRGLTSPSPFIQGLSDADKLKLSMLCMEAYQEALAGPDLEEQKRMALS